MAGKSKPFTWEFLEDLFLYGLVTTWSVFY